MLIDDLNNARVGNPFETLGLQKVEGQDGYVLRAWLPDAKGVDVYTIDGKNKVATLNLVNPDGLFEAQLNVDQSFHYMFKVYYQDSQVDVIDP